MSAYYNIGKCIVKKAILINTPKAFGELKIIFLAFARKITIRDVDICSLLNLKLTIPRTVF